MKRNCTQTILMKSLLFILLLVLSFSPDIFAQEELTNYRQAQQLISNGNYGQAMDLLSPYLADQRYGKVSHYATYHYARAAYESRQYDLAKNSLQKILQLRNWEHQDDAKYLMALSHFQEQNIQDALTVIADIEDEAVLEEAHKASYDFLQHVSTSVLMIHLPNFQDNKGLVLALRNQLDKRTVLSSGEQTVYNQIRNLDFSGKTTKEFERKVNQTLEVAVVLPFNYNGGSGVKRLGDNNFVFELYKGIKFAADRAQEEGISLVLRTFDTERNSEVIEKILDDPFFQLADVIIGPIYPEESEIVAKYAEERQIPFVNPLSNISNDRSDLRFSYLFRPSVKTIIDGILKYNNRFSGKRMAVAYSGTSRDELLAKQYSESATKMGFQVVSNKRVSGKDMRGFFEDLRVESGNSSRVDQIIVFSDDPNVASPTFAVMESLTSNIPVLVMDSWLYFNFASYEMLDIQNFHFVGNNSINVAKDEVGDFREDFFARYNIYPDLNAHLGYELIYWISNSINHEKGFDFQENLDQGGFQEGQLTFGFDFQNSRSNNHVPILRLEDGILEVE